MNKYTVLVASCLLSFQANAAESYVSVRIHGADMNNDQHYSLLMHETLGSASAHSAAKIKTNADDDVFGASLAYGVKQDALRGEIELKMQEDAKKNSIVFASPAFSKVQSKSVFLNGYYDFHNTTKITPYVGLGIGMTRLKAASGVLGEHGVAAAVDAKDTKFSWQIGAGVSYAVSQKMAVDLGYRYVDYGKVKGSYISRETEGAYTADELDFVKTESSANEIYLGFRYAF